MNNKIHSKKSEFLFNIFQHYVIIFIYLIGKTKDDGFLHNFTGTSFYRNRTRPYCKTTKKQKVDFDFYGFGQFFLCGFLYFYK